MVENTFIPRILLDKLKEGVRPGRVVVVYGPRQVGKTTLLKKYAAAIGESLAFYNGEDLEVQKLFTAQSIAKYQSLLAGKELLIIDEAQKIESVGLNLKIIVDHLPKLKVIASGSSSFDLARQVGEPLTGRKRTLTLFPLSQIELGVIEDPLETKSNLEERLIYGAYPEVLVTNGFPQKQQVLQELVSSYLYKDILELNGVRRSKKIVDLLTLLAFQIGKEVSLSELGGNLGMSKDTVARYLDLLEQTFVLINIRGFSRNLRKEVTKNSRYYFYDTGVRNALVGNFNNLNRRNDVGMLWENYAVIERLKKRAYQDIHGNNYFWRTYDQKEVDWVEEREGKLFGYEIKWGEEKTKAPKDWLGTYSNASFEVVNKNNYLDFIT
jgi:predicted AAA+ superfamily ATPase